MLLLLLAGVGQLPAASGQSVEFFGQFNSYTQNIVQYPQGIVADASGNLYITGTTNLTYIPVNASGTPLTADEFHIDNCCGNAYGLAIDAANNLYRPDIDVASYNGSPCGVAEYTYNSLNNFTKSCIGSGWIRPSSVAVDSGFDVFVLEASNGTVYKLIPSAGSYSQVAVYGPDTALVGTTGMSLDAANNLYLTSGPNTGTSPGARYAENATAAVYKLTLSGGVYTRSTVGSGWTSPSATTVDHSGNVWVSDYGANEVSVLIPAGSSYTQVPYTSIVDLRTLVTNKSGQLYGLAWNSRGDALIWTGGAEPHGMPTPNLGSATTVTVTVTFSAATTVGNVSVLTDGATGQDFTDAGGTCTAQTYAAGASCTVDVSFAPQSPGLRTGALVIDGPGGVVLGTDYFYGVGSGPVVAFDPGLISTYAGTGNACDGTLSTCGDGGSAASATFNNPGGVVFDGSGNLYIADAGDYAVRNISPAGMVTTIAGTGSACTSASGACGDGGLATSATFTSPTGLAIDGAGNLYVIDSGANRVREIAAGSGIITTIAGTGGVCSSATAACGDGGPAASATFNMEGHGGAIVDQFGNLVIADYGDNRLRSINLSAGTIVTISGTGAPCGSPTGGCGDGGQAASAQLNGPAGVGTDSSGDYFIADSLDNRVREVSYLTGAISTVAGSGTACSAPLCGDGGAALSAQLNAPVAVTTDPAGNIYIADTGDNATREVFASTGAMSVVAGSYLTCGSPTASCGDGGGAPSAQLSGPNGLVLQSTGNIFIADAMNRIRQVNISQTSPLSFPNTDAGSTSAPLFIAVANIGNAPLSFSSTPSVTTGFEVAPNSSCVTSLAEGAACGFSFDFAPTAVQSYTGNATITDNSLNGTSVQQIVGLSGTGGTPVSAATAVASTTLTQNRAAAAFSPVTGTGGVAPLTYSVAPALPSGLSMSSSGLISGAPTVVSAAASYTVTITDADGGSASATFSLGVVSAVSAATTVASTTLTQNHAAVAFSPVTGTGGAAPLTYSVAPALPSGLSMSSTGVISGTPTVVSAAANYTVTVTDANGITSTATFRLAVNSALSALTAVASTTLMQNRAALAFSPVMGTGGSAPLTYSVAPALPSGLSMSSTGVISGTPTVVSAAANYTVTVTDANGITSTATFRLAVNSALSALTAVASTTLTQNRAAVGFTPVTGTGGSAPLSYSVAPALPSGLSMSATGVISGTPTVVSAAANYTVTITDANGATATATFKLTVNVGIVLTAPSAAATLTVYGSGPIFVPVAVAGGVAPLTYSVSPALPAGLSLSPTTGAITGVPTAASGGGIYTITVTDADGATASASFSLIVTQQPSVMSLSAVPAVASAGQPVTLTAKVTATLAGTAVSPGGTVTFFDNGVSLGAPVNLVNGIAQLIMGSLPAGVTASITAVYSGNPNFLGSKSNSVTSVAIAPLDFTFTGTGTSAYTATPGAIATYRFNLAPVNGGYPGPVTFTVTGLPMGAVASFTPSSAPVDSGAIPVGMTVQTALTSALVEGGGSASRYGLMLALVLLPFSGRRSLRTKAKSWAVLLLLLAPILTIALTGCGSTNGFLKQGPQTYTLTVTATGAAVQHSQEVTLIVQ